MNGYAAATAHMHSVHHQHNFFNHLSNLSFMSHLNFKPNESNMKVPEKVHDQTNSNMKPSSFLSAKSKKIGGFMTLSTEKKANSNSSGSQKNAGNEKGNKKVQMSTPKIKSITGFSLNNAEAILAGLTGRVDQSNTTMKSNIKMPIATYQMPKELLFNSHSENKNGFGGSCDSKKSLA